MAVAIKIISILLALYVSVLAALFLAQRSMMYFPDRNRPEPQKWNASTAEIAKVTTDDGLELEGWYFPPANPDMPTLAYFHGNAFHLGGRYEKNRPYIEAGYGVLLAGYRGYGGNPGSPSEAGFYNDGRAYLSYLEKEKNTPSSKIIPYGESIGSGVAVQIALEYKTAGLILESPFSSALDVAKLLYPFFPTTLLLRDQYRSSEKIQKITAPVLIIHGDRDTTIPLNLGKKLFESANEPKTMIILEGAGHNDLYHYGAALHVLRFLSTIKPAEL